MPIIPVILSGGSGTRLWPMSSASRPKQFLPLTGPDTMLELTAARVAEPALFAPPVVVGGLGHEADIRALGYRLAIYPGACLKEVIQGSDEALRELHETGRPRAPLPGSSVMATFRRLGADDWDIVRQAAMQGAPHR